MFGKVDAREVGNAVDVSTRVELVGPATLSNKYNEYAERMIGLKEKIGKFEEKAAAGSSKRASLAQQREAVKASAEIERLSIMVGKLQGDMDVLLEDLEQVTASGSVSAHVCMHANVTLDIDGVQLRNTEPRMSVRAYTENGQIIFAHAGRN